MKRIAAGWLLIAVTGMANAQDKPNVVIMLADNVGYGDIGAYGAGEIRGMPTPRIDSIAAQGLRLTQYLVEPACTPSRAALISGRYSQRLGLAHRHHRRHAEHAPGERGDSRRTVQERGLRHRYDRQVASRRERAELADPPGLR